MNYIKKYFLFIFGCFISLNVFAVVGENIAQDLGVLSNQGSVVKKDVKQVGGASSYKVVSYVENDVLITQYVLSSGIVFGATWSGPSKPNLVELLGKFSPVLNQPNGGKGLATMTDNNIEVISNRSGRVYSGSAFVKNLMPIGFTLN